jgi:hypothetical protein
MNLNRLVWTIVFLSGIATGVLVGFFLIQLIDVVISGIGWA